MESSTQNQLDQPENDSEAVSLSPVLALQGNSHFLFRQSITLFYMHPAEFTCASVLTILGVLGNTMNIVVLRGFKNNAVFYLLEMLAIFDLATCVVSLCMVAHKASGLVSGSRAVGRLFTYFFFPVVLIIPSICSFITLAICITRLVMIRLPFKAKVWANVRAARVVVGIIVIFVLGIRLPFLCLGLRVLREEVAPGKVLYQLHWNAWFFTKVGQDYFLAIHIVCDFLVTLSMAIISIFMLMTLHKHNKQVAHLAVSSSKKDDQGRQLRLMMTSVVILHCICSFPKSISRMIRLPRDIQDIVVIVADLLVYFNHSVNLCMYLIIHGWFRQETMKKMRWILRRLGQRNSDTTQ